MKITHLRSRELLDSRGNPTLEAEMTINNQFTAKAIVPSGASTGENEAVELRDNDKNRYLGKGVLKAVENVNTIIANQITNVEVGSQRSLDNILIELDGTSDKRNLGANSILGVSMAFSRASALCKGLPLFKSFASNFKPILPVPMINIVNGGSHANNNVDFQEFMIFPIGTDSFSEAVQVGAEVFHALKSLLHSKGFSTAVGDEGGFAPNLKSNEEAIEIILQAISNASYEPGKEVFLCLDVAASEFFKEGMYNLSSENKVMSTDQMIEYLKRLTNQYPIISIEDGLDQNDWNGWTELTKQIGSSCQIVGDDLTVTNKVHLERSIQQKSMNAVLIKLNQIGTVTETIHAIDLAKKHGFGTIISHRSGETEDTIISDLAVSMGSGQIKTGSLSRTDRVAKYNQLLRIEEELGSSSIFPSYDMLGLK
ncbi:MAG: phosphopyruvate hydratase [Candidatus Marinimicrobia bacterium]|nr:phosphopyruvate hydratase [Candidatus Neomarinimicrobiota bacterium]|tara:strand:+ start:8726 stop:10003 length:1278 start_codon:yes stop_codon:yes gene_type:complete